MTNMGQRNKKDFYQTPYCLTRELLEREELEGTVLEPACGKGAIVKVLHEYDYDPEFYDLNEGFNFLEETNTYDTIITNPPFSLANDFIEHAKKIYNKKIIMLLPLNYLHGQYRYESGIFSQLKTLYVFTRYPMLEDTIREDGNIEKTGMQVFMWAVWNKPWKRNPSVEWIDINKYILRSSKYGKKQ